MNTLRHSTTAFSFALVVVLLGFSAGCGMKSADWKPSQLFSLDNTWPFRDKDKPQEGTPVRMIGTWTDTVFTQQGQKSQRGFGGRIMFYEKDEPKPILVNGQLVVYAFDETGREPTDTKPTRRYVFPAEQIPQHMSKSEIGASYSFWLPWDEAGGPRTQVSLICRFEPKEGAIITSEQTKHLLPGTIPTNTASSKQPPKLPEGVPSTPSIQTLETMRAARAQQASYETDVPIESATATAAGKDVAAAPPRKMSATTITLPSNYQLPSGAGIQSQLLPAQNSARLPAQMQQAPVMNGAGMTTLPSTSPMVAAPAVNPQSSATFGFQPQQMQLPQTMPLPAPRQFTPQAPTWTSGPTAPQQPLQPTTPTQQMTPQMGQLPAWPQAPAQSRGAASVSYLPTGQTLR